MRAIACSVVLLAAGAAEASTVNLQHMTNGMGRMVRASINNQHHTVFAGRLNHTMRFSNGSTRPVTSFSTDLFQGVSSTLTPYNATTIAQLSGNGGITNLGMARMQAVYDLFAAAQGRQYSLGHDYATAFQVALWEVVYDLNATAPGQNLNLESGAFKATQPDGTMLSSSIREKVAALFQSVVLLNAANPGVSGYRSEGYGDQVAVVVPLPTGVWLGLGGLGLAFAVRRRFR